MSHDELNAALDLFDTLCESSPAERDRVLSTVPPAVAARVRAMLDADHADDGIDLDDVELALVLELAGDDAAPPSTPIAPDGFVLGECLGRGGMGVVYAATQRAPRRTVAIKFLYAGTDPGAALAEAQALADLEHPVFPVVFEVGGGNGGPIHIAMEHIDGVRLTHWARDRPRSEIIDAFILLCDGVGVAHDAGFVHRDLKPANVLVDATGPRVIDFGLAERIDQRELAAGTPAYMAPELLEGAANASPVTSPLADVFSLGVMLVECLTGTRPTPEGRTAAAQRRARGHHPPCLHELDEPLAAIARRAMADASRRYPSVDALAADLRRIRAGHVPEAVSGHLGLRTRWAIWRHRRIVAATVALAALTVCVLGFQAYTRYRVQRSASVRAESVVEQVRNGDPDAPVLLDRFIDLPDVQGTEGWATALLERARHRETTEPEGARMDRARVYASEVSAQKRNQAGSALARSFAESGRWGALATIASQLASDDATHWRKTAAFALRRFDDPLLADDPLARAFTESRRLDARPVRVQPGRWNGRDVVVSIQGSERDIRLFSADPALETLARFTLPAEFGEDTHTPTVLGEWIMARSAHDRHALVVAPLSDPTAWVRTSQFGRPWSFALGSVGGTPEQLYVGTAPAPRLLRAIDPRTGATRAVAPALDLLGSDLHQLAILDLDADGSDELVVAHGAWTQHDLKALTLDEDGDLVLLARRQLGGVARFAPLPSSGSDGVRLFVVKEDAYPNRVVFGEDDPVAGAPGLYVLDYVDGEGWVEHDFMSYEGLDTGRPPVVADLDGDGLVEAFVGAPHVGMKVVGFDEHGRIAGVRPIAGMLPMAAVQLDDDPADELFVRLSSDDHHLWVIGAGTRSEAPRGLPPEAIERTDVERTDVGPTDVGPTDVLAEIGLFAEAAERQELLASFDPDHQAEHLRAAAGHWRTAGRPQRALEVLDQVEGGRQSPLGQALSTEVHDFAYVDDPAIPPSWREPPVALDFVNGLPALNWRDVDGVRHRPGSGLTLELVGGDEVPFELPIEITSSRLGLAVDLDIEQFDAGASLSIEVVQGDQRWALTTRAGGGGGYTFVKSGCRLYDPGIFDHAYQPVSGVSEPRRATLRLDQAARAFRCEARLDDHEAVESEHLPRPPGLGPGLLRVRAGTHSNTRAPIAHVVLRHLALQGAEVVAFDEPEHRRVRVEGRAGRLDLDRLQAVDRVFVLEQQGRIAQARAAVDASMLDAHWPRFVAAMRRRPSAWLSVLADHPGSVRARLYAESWGSRSTDHPGAMDPLDHVGVDDLPHDDLPTMAGVLLDRARLYVRAGHMDRAERLLRRLLTPDHGDLGDHGHRLPASVELADLLAARGDTAEAARICVLIAAESQAALYLFDQRSRRPALDAACREGGVPTQLEDSH